MLTLMFARSVLVSADDKRPKRSEVLRKRTVTTIEMHQTITVKRPASASLGWCPVCRQEIEMVPLEAASILAGVSLRAICRQVGADHLHFIETADGGLVCTNSLLNGVSTDDEGLNSDSADTLSLPPLEKARGDE